ncbi:MAG: MerR family DNA-binding transcriptional regulator [Rhodospirillaceae bacterium]|jgi:DNA-binding transcriptional MerR regulator|nr:MerR family DNA-binding transcriptional regulator [Rhodospirillaceae bacterium]MBT6119568.1 MerR family DNA-binding transcriptional regulator [Rhodospirillaceae bacterium]
MLHGAPYTITELAEAFEVTARTLRFYEDCGLLDPERRGRTRLYSERDRKRLRLALRGKRLGFSLEEIKEMLDLHHARPGQVTEPDALRARIEAHRARLTQYREDAEIALDWLDALEARLDRLVPGAARRAG